MQKQQREKQSPVLADFALRMVERKGQRYSLVTKAEEGLRLALDGMFENKALDPKAEIEALLRLGWLFEAKYGAVEVADGIIEILSKDDRALSLLGINSGRKTRELRKRFAMFVGRDDKVAAPVYGQSAPKGSLKVSSFLEPGQEMRRGKKPTVAPKSTAAATKRSSTPRRRRFKTS